MEEPVRMLYYQRTTIRNRMGQWHEVGLPYSQWIQEYFRQPIRDQMVSVTAVDEDGDRVHYRCMAETNDKLSGWIMDEVRVEIVQCRENRVEETLARYP